jgi:hypothetical protein
VYIEAIDGEGWFRLLSFTSNSYGSCALEKLFRVTGRDLVISFSLDGIVLQISRCGEQVLDFSQLSFGNEETNILPHT